jgi:hypothetical protein
MKLRKTMTAAAFTMAAATNANAVVYMCRPCAAGTFAAAGATGCTECSGNKEYSSAGASGCSTCPTGQKANAAHTACEAITCLAGEYLSDDSCVACGNNATSLVGSNGRNACACLPHEGVNQYYPIKGSAANGCNKYCIGGYYMPAGEECQHCPGGQWTNGTNRDAECLSCGANAEPNDTQTNCNCKSGYAIYYGTIETNTNTYGSDCVPIQEPDCPYKYVSCFEGQSKNCDWGGSREPGSGYTGGSGSSCINACTVWEYSRRCEYTYNASSGLCEVSVEFTYEQGIGQVEGTGCTDSIIKSYGSMCPAKESPACPASYTPE